MVLMVSKNGKTYFIKEMTNTGVSIKKSKENKFMICLDDRPEPVAIYSNWEKANSAMGEIMTAYENDRKIAVIEPND
jgi:hypothetical protein